jgi:ABC-type transporter Mla subunit MlaD
MNNRRRKELNAVIDRLRAAADEASNLYAYFSGTVDEEHEAFENMPEGLQQSEKGEATSEALDALDSALGMLETVMDDLNQIADDLGELV